MSEGWISFLVFFPITLLKVYRVHYAYCNGGNVVPEICTNKVSVSTSKDLVDLLYLQNNLCISKDKVEILLPRYFDSTNYICITNDIAECFCNIKCISYHVTRTLSSDPFSDLIQDSSYFIEWVHLNEIMVFWFRFNPLQKRRWI